MHKIFSNAAKCLHRALIAGSMICLGKNNYFRFNHPKEAARIKAELPNSRFSIVPDNVYPGKLEYTYFK